MDADETPPPFQPGPGDDDELQRLWLGLSPERRRFALRFLRWLAGDAGMLTDEERQDLLERLSR
ncbi:hypothetical protein RGI145_19405 [Roseomonas gilardii]|uniref:Uncharacterized protein n=1 Tax=Roseomonas gilardii TaxID=257708 RepID=A0A1L7AL92_9PROT|nr:hypothetical protein [Roseomonas gilardii]APT59516.1 hypothetical protein RGI145_19405 [Roseomonas gilardii]